jgi:hypothetical protein
MSTALDTAAGIVIRQTSTVVPPRMRVSDCPGTIGKGALNTRLTNDD